MRVVRSDFALTLALSRSREREEVNHVGLTIYRIGHKLCLYSYLYKGDSSHAV